MAHRTYLPPTHPIRLARQVLVDLDIKEPPVDERAILQYFGITLDRTPLDSVPNCKRLDMLENNIIGMLVPGSEEEAPLIWVDPGVSGGRERWTVFHEIGHHDIPSHEAPWFWDEDRVLRPAEGRRALLPIERGAVGYQGCLLAGTPDSVNGFVPVAGETPDSAKRRRQEREANLYAAELIMPAPFFFPEARDLPVGISAISQLANRYLASFEAAAIRYATACPERCLVLAAEPLIDPEGIIVALEVVYSRRASRFLPGLRAGLSLPFAGLFARAWEARGPVQGRLTGRDLGLDSGLTVSTDVLRLGRQPRIVAILWLESGQLPMFRQGGYL